MNDKDIVSGSISEEEIVCIMCPLGCRLQVKVRTEDGEKEVIEIAGNTCKRGREYAHEEVLDPKRIVTATCKIRMSGKTVRFPVKTDSTVPVDCIADLLTKLYEVSLDAPVLIGDVVLSDVDGRGTNVIATKSVEE